MVTTDQTRAEKGLGILRGNQNEGEIRIKKRDKDKEKSKEEPLWKDSRPSRRERSTSTSSSSSTSREGSRDRKYSKRPYREDSRSDSRYGDRYSDRYSDRSRPGYSDFRQRAPGSDSRGPAPWNQRRFMPYHHQTLSIRHHKPSVDITRELAEAAEEVSNRRGDGPKSANRTPDDQSPEEGEVSD